MTDLEGPDKLKAYDKIKSLEDDFRFAARAFGELARLVNEREGNGRAAK